MNRFTAFGVALALFLSSSADAIADPIDDATRQTSAADAKAASVSAAMTKLGRLVSAQQEVTIKLLRQMDQAQARRTRLDPLFDQTLKSADAAVVAAQGELAARKKEVDDAERALAEAKTRLGERRRAVESATVTQRQAFESSARFVDAGRAVTTRQAEVEALVKSLDAGSGDDFAVSAARKRVSEAEAEVAALRAAVPADADALAAASARWIAAKGELDAARQNLFARHRPYVDALEKLREAQRGVAVLDAEFDASIRSLPGVAEALRAVKDAADDVAGRERQLDAAKKAVDRAALALERSKAQVVLIRRIKTESDIELDAMEADIRRLQLDLRTINSQLGDAIDDVTGIRTALRAVAEALRKADAEPKRP